MHVLPPIALNETIFIPFNATDPATGDSVVLATDGTIKVYKGASLTQRTSASGITFDEDADAITGRHSITIDTSDNDDAGFYVNNQIYTVVIDGAVVVGADPVNVFLAQFKIDQRILCLVDNATDTLLARYGFATDTAAAISTTAGLFNNWHVYFLPTASIGAQSSFVVDCVKVSTVERLIIAPVAAAPANNDPFYLSPVPIAV
jgi:hypothetical protein